MRACAAPSLLVALGCVVMTTTARAHESAATAPEFDDTPCLMVVDRNAEPVIELAYSLPFDDVELGEGDIRVADAKTHQFFAFEGAMVARGFAHELYDFDAPGEAVLLPEWITVEDAKRAANASGDADGTGFSESDVPPGSTLDGVAELEGRWLRVTADDARVPITLEQAALGFSWDVSGVEPGIYTVTGYVFSPPYNAWAPRPGLVVITDGELTRPAARLHSVDEFLFSYQGRRVQGCLAAPEGTTLEAYFRVEERLEEGWIRWGEASVVEGDAIDLCFHNPRPELTGSVRIRLDLRAPSGETTTIYSADTITSLSGTGDCSADETICCDFAAEATGEDTGAGDSGAAGVVPGVASADAGDGAGSDAAVADDADAEDGAGAVTDGGCAVGALRGVGAARAPRGGSPGALLLGLLLCVVCRRARRGPR